ncbi:uncharacterized protein LOC122311328 [Carya illinoinensis]|uniref:uncharacterized protein LOC122311328 n=1 Tax=Carya illinoinensis TaxID=32201 RepID=UPI001C7288E7|nr:uncharacterized protein LOC122311328 [Carya illinoinensis]
MGCWIRGGLGGLVLEAWSLCCAAWLGWPGWRGAGGMVQMLCGMARAWSEWCRWPGLVLPSMDWCCARAGVSAWSCTWLWSGRCRCQQVLVRGLLGSDMVGAVQVLVRGLLGSDMVGAVQCLVACWWTMARRLCVLMALRMGLLVALRMACALRVAGPCVVC